MNARRNPLTCPLVWSVLTLALIIFSQHKAEIELWGAWQTEEYSHGVLIPFIALLIAWHKLSETKPEPRPSWLGLAFLIFAGVLQILAQLSAFYMAAQISLIIAAAGVSLAFLGRAATRAITPALIYLIFAIPLPHLVQANLSQNLQLISSSLGVIPLDLLGVSVFQEGNVIDLGGYKLQVVEACSGLRYLFPLMSFGYLIAFLLKDSWWKRIVIFLSSIPITIALNSLRIAFIGFTVDKWGVKMAEGFVHDFEGWSVFLVCITVLLAETWVLQRIGHRGHFRYEYLGIPRRPFFRQPVKLETPGITAFVFAVLLALLFGSGFIDQRDEVIPKRPPLATFPFIIGDWRGVPDRLTPEVINQLQASDYWLANYTRAATQAPVNLYISYYESQRMGTMAHSPSNCIPGGGWQIEGSRIDTIPLARGVNIKLTRLVIRRGSSATLVYYWFDERGRDLTETYSAKWYLIWDSIFMHRTDGALIRILTPITNNDEAAAAQRLNGFLELVYPQIRQFIPGFSPL